MNAQRQRLSGGRRDVIKGVSEQVIRVRVPVPGVFREAVFFLHEDYLRQKELSREELLRQAMSAAEAYLQPCLPDKKEPAWWPYPLLLLLGMGLGLGMGVYIGL